MRSGGFAFGDFSFEFGFKIGATTFKMAFLAIEATESIFLVVYFFFK